MRGGKQRCRGRIHEKKKKETGRESSSVLVREEKRVVTGEMKREKWKEIFMCVVIMSSCFSYAHLFLNIMHTYLVYTLSDIAWNILESSVDYCVYAESSPWW